MAKFCFCFCFLLINKLPSLQQKNKVQLILILTEVNIFFSYAHVTLDFLTPIPECRAVRTPHVIKGGAICMC